MQKKILAPDASPEPRDGREPESGGLTLVDFLQIVRVRRNLIAGTAAAVIVLAAVLVLQMTPLYSATAVVMLDQRKNNVTDVDAVLSGLPSDQSSIQNQVQILTSLELAGRVVDKLKLDADPEFNGTAAGWSSALKYLNPMRWFGGGGQTQAAAQGVNLARSAVIQKFLARLSVDPINLSTAINVTFQSQDPEKAARVANAVANAYVEDQLEAKFEATQKATQWLSGRITELSRKAQLADAAVQQYKAANNITDTAGGGSVVQQQIMDINSQLIIAKGQLSEKQTTYSNLAGLAASGRAADSPLVVASPLIATLRAQEADLLRQIGDLDSKYGPRHPKMLDLTAQKANIDAKIAEEIRRVVEAARNDASIAGARVGSLEASLHQIEAKGAGQNQAEVQLTALQSAATSARSMYEAFLGRLNQTQGQEGIQTPDARVLSPADVPQAPSFPKKGLSIGLSIPAGIILGLMLAFAAERLDSGFRTSAQVEHLLGIPVLATVPEVKGASAATVILDKPMSSFAEALRGLQLGLTLSNVDDRPKVIVVTSSVPGEGKTTIAISLARMAANSGLRTLIIDADLRRPSIAKVIGLKNGDKGLIEVLADGSVLEAALVKDPRSAAVVLPCLKSPSHAADLLGSRAMQQMIATARRAFDLVIVDSAPLLPVHDTRIISRLADAVLFVVRWEQTPRDATVHALHSLSSIQAPVAGIALARADNKRFRYYSYGYQNYYNYDKYYSE